MSQEYYSVERESNLGDLNIGLSVFQAIVEKAVDSIDGIQFEGNMIPIPGKGPVNVTINKNNQVFITIAILVDYGSNVTTLTTMLQNKVVQNCFEMTGIKNVKVNVEVKGINF
ncbi:Asp23/Gls24 family envelope stress response protein [uncultured Thomasclavelia sp.]|uniref:Asp23/Gls24 family envelope stress response protein n=1 Tax=uncultured Thomasclavelia sp. TaxID=3025759 RepID=UPI0025E61B73|nr:Asp23/Gls24 family envelope stress response protein [uncultured Thomasclavelia sp.]